MWEVDSVKGDGPSVQLYSHFQRSADLFPDRVAFIQPDGTKISYASALDQVEGFAQTLLADGASPGANVAILAPNDARGFMAMLGTLRAGMAWVSLNSRNTLEDNLALAAMADVTALFYHSEFAQQARSLQTAIPQLRSIHCIDPISERSGHSFDHRANNHPTLPDLSRDEQRACTIFATGGTTGRSKGAVWTDQTWETLIANFWTCAPEAEHAVHLCVAPMTHAAGVLSFMLLPRAATNVIMAHADPEEILRAIEQHRVTHLFLPPTVLYALLSYPKLKDFDTSSLIFFLISAAPVSPAKLKEAVAAFGPVMCQSFGQAEAPFFLTYLSANDHMLALSSDEHSRILQSCGRPTMFSQVEIMDEDGVILATGETGEIVARGNLVMPGYYKDPEATASVSEHGWHHTGDIGYKDDAGYVFIVDRKRDMIISGGFNVFSTEVESALLSHPMVLDCAVIGVPDEKWGEAVKAVVELKPGSANTSTELISHCKNLLGSVKAPKSIDIWETLPRSPVGKVLKRAIREKFWTGRERAI